MSIKHGYQYEKLGASIRSLMSLNTSVGERLAFAMNEFNLAFRMRPDDPLPDRSAVYLDKIDALTSGEGTYAERIERLSSSQRSELTTAFFELYAAVARAYYEALLKPEN